MEEKKVNSEFGVKNLENTLICLKRTKLAAGHNKTKKNW